MKKRNPVSKLGPKLSAPSKLRVVPTLHAVRLPDRYQRRYEVTRERDYPLGDYDSPPPPWTPWDDDGGGGGGDGGGSSRRGSGKKRGGLAWEAIPALMLALLFFSGVFLAPENKDILATPITPMLILSPALVFALLWFLFGKQLIPDDYD